MMQEQLIARHSNTESINKGVEETEEKEETMKICASEKSCEGQMIDWVEMKGVCFPLQSSLFLFFLEV
jgi:hypothetical protein